MSASRWRWRVVSEDLADQQPSLMRELANVAHVGFAGVKEREVLSSVVDQPKLVAMWRWQQRRLLRQRRVYRVVRRSS